MAKWCGDGVSVKSNIPFRVVELARLYQNYGKRHVEPLLAKPLKHAQFGVIFVGNQSLFCRFDEYVAGKCSLLSSDSRHTSKKKRVILSLQCCGFVCSLISEPSVLTIFNHGSRICSLSVLISWRGGAWSVIASTQQYSIKTLAIYK